MSLIALGAAKGRPGVTTAALALAAVWPGPCVLAETDPSGGDLALRLPGADTPTLRPGRGVPNLADPLAGDAGQYAQRLTGGVPLLAGPVHAGHGQALGPGWARIGQALAGLSEDVLADCGRLWPPSPAFAVAREAAQLLVLTRPQVDAVFHLLGLLGELRTELAGNPAERAAPRLAVVVVHDTVGHGPEREVADALARRHPDVPVLGRLVWDPAAAQALAGGPPRRLERSALVESARVLATVLRAQPATGRVDLPGTARRETEPAGPCPELLNVDGTEGRQLWLTAP